MTALKLHSINDIFDRMTKGYVGFDDVMNRYATTLGATKTNYPPYNIAKTTEGGYLIEVAVAGFDHEDLDVEVHENILYIRGNRKQEDQESKMNFYYKGIAERNFELKFVVPEFSEIHGAVLKNGIMTIAIQQQLPEERKPKKIALTYQA